MKDAARAAAAEAAKQAGGCGSDGGGGGGAVDNAEDDTDEAAAPGAGDNKEIGEPGPADSAWPSPQKKKRAKPGGKGRGK